MDPLQHYFDHGITVFPLSKNSKKPMNAANWRNSLQNEKRLREYVKKGYNAAAIIPPDRIVLDVDVRNGGIESLKRLNHELGLQNKLEDTNPTVVTPTGGYHIWLKIDPSLKTRGKLDSTTFPGIDVKKRGGYVVAAGSEIGNYKYEWRGTCVKDGKVSIEPTVVTPKLEKLVKRKVVDEHSPSSEAGEFDGQDIGAILSHLEVTDFRSRDEWLQLMMSCHFASGGDHVAGEEFVQWSAKDPEYCTSEMLDDHREQWRRLTLDGGVTSATLMHLVKEKATDLAELKMTLFGTTMSSREDFTDYTKEVDGEVIQALPFGIVDIEELETMDLKVNYLIEDVLVEKQVMLVSGPQKALKTTSLLDMALSLSTGTPFLNRFAVPEKKKVLFLTAESGLGTIRDKLNSIVEARELGCKACREGSEESCYLGDGECCFVEDLGDWKHSLYIGNEVPKISSGHDGEENHDVEHLIRVCRMKEIDVVMIDPAYLALMTEDSSNLFVMGAMLRSFLDTLKELDVTVIIAHHNTKATGRNIGKDPTLADMSGSGFAEFARQWLLIGFQDEYKFDGHFKLAMSIGGSAGHSGLYRMNVFEGVKNGNESEAAWRRWEVKFNDLNHDFKSVEGDINGS